MQPQPIVDETSQGTPPVEPAFAAVLDRIGGLEKQVSLLPPQVRNLAAKVDGLSTSIVEPRIRSLLAGLLGLYDLIDQVLRTLPNAEVSPAEHQRNYEVLKTQVGLLLDANGLYQIAAAGTFDPQVHRALESVPVDDPAKAGGILEVVRPGFRTDQAVLRYAEVTVGRFTAPPVTAAAVEEAPTAQPEPENPADPVQNEEDRS